MAMSAFDEYQRLLAEGDARRREMYGEYDPSQYEEKAPSATSGTAAQIVGIGGSIAAKKLVEKYLAKKATEEVAKDVATKEVAKQAAAQAAQAPTIGGSSSAFVDKLAPIGQNADGTMIYPGQGPVPAPFSLADGAGTTVAIINGIDAFNNLRNGNKRGKIEGGTTAAGTAIGYFLGGPAGAGVGSVVGRTAGRGLAHVFGGGVTKREQEKNTKDLLALGFLEDQLAGRINPDKSDPNYKKVPTEAIMRDPASMWGTYGMQSTFGPGYFNDMSEKDRWAVTQAAIDNNLLKGKHGDVIVTDRDKLRSLADEAKNSPLYAEAYKNWLEGRSAPVNASAIAKALSAPAVKPTLTVVNPNPGLTTSTKMATAAPVVVIPQSGGGAFNLPMTGDVSKVAKAKRYNDFRREGAYR